jgi:hypothetical protein
MEFELIRRLQIPSVATTSLILDGETSDMGHGIEHVESLDKRTIYAASRDTAHGGSAVIVN